MAQSVAQIVRLDDDAVLRAVGAVQEQGAHVKPAGELGGNPGIPCGRTRIRAVAQNRNLRQEIGLLQDEAAGQTLKAAREQGRTAVRAMEDIMHRPGKRSGAEIIGETVQIDQIEAGSLPLHPVVEKGESAVFVRRERSEPYAFPVQIQL
jgi:hypothetical protein